MGKLELPTTLLDPQITLLPVTLERHLMPLKMTGFSGVPLETYSSAGFNTRRQLLKNSKVMTAYFKVSTLQAEREMCKKFICWYKLKGPPKRHASGHREVLYKYSN